MSLTRRMRENLIRLAVAGMLIVFGHTVTSLAQKSSPSATPTKVAEIEKQKKNAESEIKETKAELSATEKKVNNGLASLRKIEADIEVSNQEIATVQGQLKKIKANISKLETNIAEEESRLAMLREEYLKAVKKMRVSRKKVSGIAFLFSSKSFGEARRRLRYMNEFSEWKERRSDEIKGKVESLKTQKEELVQAHNDAALALQREEAAQEKLKKQQVEQQQTVAALREQSDALKSKLAKRQAEAKKLSNQISALIAEERAREAEEKRKAEEKRLAEEKRKAEEQRLAEEKRKAEEQRLAEEKRKAQEKQLAEEKSKKSEEKSKKAEEKPKKESQTQKEEKSKSAGNNEYAEARKRQPRTNTETPSTSPSASSALSFEQMRGKLPKPVSGSFRIVSAFGVHPISPELPDIMDENLGIDAHVSNGAAANAIFEGEVLKIYDRSNTPGFRNIIVVKHGNDYITVYANMETLNVKTGDRVKAGQSLGTVGSDFDDASKGLLHFEIWKNQTHLDPAAWIKL